MTNRQKPGRHPSSSSPGHPSLPRPQETSSDQALGAVFPWQLQDPATPMKSAMISAQRQLAWELTAAQKRNSFGSCQEKKIFPCFHAADRLGNEYVPIKGDPDRGPGAYNHAERNTLLYHLVNKPESTKGYTMGARTAPRFGLIKKPVVPDPAEYQAAWIKQHKHRPAFAPFSSHSPRFSDKLLDKDFFPGPGTYDPNKIPHRHVTWPGRFGSPDWDLVPMPEKRTFKAELLTDKEFKKHRNLVAYLSIYYSD
ncbi:protein pitchfork [Sceloporus undulatus]|uniref:protein pitchfork n=1 Tax=Sceloporus undulatus TaxID=8520 RepID=UPI001C4AFCA8|nr:protein pitchfork [Sceloporus undulatus]